MGGEPGASDGVSLMLGEEAAAVEGEVAGDMGGAGGDEAGEEDGEVVGAADGGGECEGAGECAGEAVGEWVWARADVARRATMRRKTVFAIVREKLEKVRKYY